MADRYGDYVKGAMKAVKRLSKNGKTNFTASETGARRNAIRNLADNPGLAAMVKRGARTPTPKGAGAQYREVESQDIESMIKRSK